MKKTKKYKYETYISGLPVMNRHHPPKEFLGVLLNYLKNYKGIKPWIIYVNDTEFKLIFKFHTIKELQKCRRLRIVLDEILTQYTIKYAYYDD